MTALKIIATLVLLPFVCLAFDALLGCFVKWLKKVLP